MQCMDNQSQCELYRILLINCIFFRQSCLWLSRKAFSLKLNIQHQTYKGNKRETKEAYFWKKYIYIYFYNI